MRLTKSSWLATSSLGLFSGAAVAQSDFYLLGTIGNSSTDLRDGVPPSNPIILNQVDGDDRSFALGGGYEFSDHVSLEGSYQHFGDLTGQTVCTAPICTFILYAPAEVDAAALSVSFVGSFRINDRLDGYGRLGLTSWELDGSSSAFDDSGEDLHYGLGLRWSFDDNWKVFADFTRVDLDLDAVSIGMRYGF